MTLKDQDPSDVINAAFYANKKRNDSDFELGYVLPLFLGNTNQSDRILVVNPSPDIVCYIEKNSRSENKRYYAVADNSELYGDCESDGMEKGRMTEKSCICHNHFSGSRIDFFTEPVLASGRPPALYSSGMKTVKKSSGCLPPRSVSEIRESF